MSRILVVSAHPDDCELGCGGTVAKHVNEGAKVRILTLSMGMMSRGEGETDRLAADQKRAHAVLGVVDSKTLTWPDNAFDTFPLLELAQAVTAAVEEYQPDSVYTHALADLNRDHRMLAEAVLVACRPPSSVQGIYAFETLSSTEWALGQFGAFKPTRFEDISATLSSKLAALACYSTEARDYPHPRSAKGIEALASYRGLAVGLTAAEAFEVVRENRG